MTPQDAPQRDSKVAVTERFFAAYAAGDGAGIAAALAPDVRWTIPGRHPLSGTKRGIPEVLAFFDQLGKAGFKAVPIFLGADEHHVVDIHRGWSTALDGKVDTMWALVWHFDGQGRIGRGDDALQRGEMPS